MHQGKNIIEHICPQTGFVRIKTAHDEERGRGFWCHANPTRRFNILRAPRSVGCGSNLSILTRLSTRMYLGQIPCRYACPTQSR
jgi:hypothetical protein